MKNFYLPTRIVFGEGERKNIGSYMEQKRLTKAYLIADPFLEENGTVDELIKVAGGRIVQVSTEVEPNPTIQNVAENAERCRETGADCVIAIGGGSAIDCAKATAAAAMEDVTCAEMMSGSPLGRALPVIAFPTTAGTGSEVTAGAVLSDKEKGIKAAVFSPVLFPAIAIVDPELTWTVPPKVTAATGLDVIAHAMDAMSSIKADDVTDALAMKATELALKYLERAVTDGADKEARAGMSKASTIVGMAFSQTGTTGSHACSYMLTAEYGMPHGEACAFTLDAWVKINAEERHEMAENIRKIGFENVEGFCTWLNEVKVKFGMRTSLSELGAGEREIEALTSSAMASANMRNNIAQIGFNGVMALYKSKL